MAHAKSQPRYQRTPTKPKGSKPKRVACLAPGVPNHTFTTADPAHERICKACRERLRANPTGAEVYGWPFGARLA